MCNLSVCNLPGVRGTGLTAAAGRKKLTMPFKCSLSLPDSRDCLFLTAFCPVVRRCVTACSACHPLRAILLLEAVLIIWSLSLVSSNNLVEVKKENVHFEMKINNFLVCF